MVPEQLSNRRKAEGPPTEDRVKTILVIVTRVCLNIKTLTKTEFAEWEFKHEQM